MNRDQSIDRRAHSLRWLALLIAFLVGVVATSLFVQWRGGPGENVADQAQFYCPMHPDYVSDEQGDCPVCSMRLVPLEGSPGPASDTMSPTTVAGEAAAQEGPSVHVPPERQQQIGVKYVAVERRPAVMTLRTAGRVAIDERRIAHVHARVGGFIEEVFVNYTGAPVRRGEPLFTMYSPDILATQQDLLTALAAARRLSKSPLPWTIEDSKALVESARKRLRLWGMTSAEIASVERTGEPIRAVTIIAPVSGIVTEREAFHHGRTVTLDLDLYTIVDFSTVWVLAQVYENELRHVRIGQEALVEMPDARDEHFEGTVSFISPQIDPMTRTASVRMEFANADLALKPEMFVGVVLRDDLGPQLMVPRDAIMDTGELQYVFVELGDGYLQPRKVSVGPDVEGGRVIREGLREGERVVSSANFLIDSESRIRGALDTMGAPSAGPSGAHAAATSAEAAGPALRVELQTDPSPARTGRNRVTVTVRDASGTPVEGARIRVRLFMPQMGSMAPMESVATLEHDAGGAYKGEVDVLMPFAWQTTITVEKDGVVLGTSQTTLNSR